LNACRDQTDEYADLYTVISRITKMRIDSESLTATTPPGETDPISGAYDSSVMTCGVIVRCY